MTLLADTNLFIKYCRRLPLPPEVEAALDNESTERCLSPVSIIELFRLWKKGAIPTDPDVWLDLALPSWTVLPAMLKLISDFQLPIADCQRCKLKIKN